MYYMKKAILWILSICLVLTMGMAVPLPVQAAEDGTIQVTCVGDSITDGYKATSGKTTYPAQLQDLLGDGYKVLNAGSSGSTVIRSLDEAYSKRGKYTTGLQSNPDIVIIMIGTNDAILGSVNTKEGQENFKKDYAALIEDYQNCGSNPKIILAVPTTSVDENNVEDDRDNKNEQYVIPIIEDLAKEYNLQLIDTHTYTGSWTRESSGQLYNYLADGLHPNDAGYGELAKLFANAILGYEQEFAGDLQEKTYYSIISRSSGKVMTIKDFSANNSAGLCQMTDMDYESQAWRLIPTEDGYYQIVNRYSGKVLDVPNSSTEQGKQIIQFNKGNGDNQKWKIEATGDGHWKISPKLSPNMALNVYGNSKEDGANIVQWPYEGAANEQWKLEVIPEVQRNPGDKIRVTCVGDSITDGIGGSKSYPTRLQ